MDYGQKLSERARSVDISQLIEEEILERTDEIVQGVREQWEQGVRPDGTIIGTYKSFAYRSEKIAMNPNAGGNVDLILTGELNSKLTVNPLREGFFTIFSNDSKASMIAQKYGLDVYNLNDGEKNRILDLAANKAVERAFETIYGQ